MLNNLRLLGSGWRLAPTLGLCTLVAGCGDVLRGGDKYGSSAQMEEALPDADPGPTIPEALVPDSPEYDQAKLALVPTTTGADPEPQLDVVAPANAIVADPGCRARSLGRVDDSSTSKITLPFSVNFFGTTQTGLFINNNGNVTFNSSFSSTTPFNITTTTPPLIAPFHADVDTRNTASGIVEFSNAPIVFEGRSAFCVNWVGVGYYNQHVDKLNSFQLLLVDRSDTGAGNFDIVMNYNQVLWETGDVNGGVGGLGGTTAAAGISLGNRDPASFYQIPGSGVRSGLLDSNAATGLSQTRQFSSVPGRHVFAVRNGQPITDLKVSMTPASTAAEVGGFATVVGSVVDDHGNPLANRAITFRIISGPNNRAAPVTILSKANGQATFSYLGASVGQDQIQASVVKSSGQTVASEFATVNWKVTPHPPVAVCRDLSLVADDACAASGSINGGSSDPDGDLVSCGASPAPSYGLGATPVTLTCTDRRGLTGTCASVVSVRDITAPVIACPATQTAECVAGAANVDVPAPRTSDNCGRTTLSGPAGTASYPLGTTPLTFSAADGSGNTASCRTSVVVADTLPPNIACSAPITAECTANSSASVDVPNATASDQCGGATVTGPVGTASFPLGTTPLDFGARDGVGHTAGCSTNVTIVDTIKPTISCPAAITAECTDHHQSLVDVPNATASDTCSSVAISGPAGSRAYPVGTTALSFTAADTSGNAATCALDITVADTTPPAITCPAPITAECTGGSSATVNVPNANASDVCGDVAVTGPTGAASYPLGTTALGFGATDDFGNSSSCATSVTVTDTIAPVFDAASLGPQTVLGHCDSSPVRFTLPTATDGCQAVSVACTEVPGDSFGANTVTCTATDGSGNHTQATMTVNVVQPLRVAFLAPLADDNVADDINADADIANLFQVKSTIPNKIKLYACTGADVTNALAYSVTARLTINYREDSTPAAGTAIVPTFTGVGDEGGVFVHNGDQLQYNLKTDTASYPAGSINNSHYFADIVTVTYNSAPNIVAGQEDARLESK
jgi:hypothetical protein